MTYSDFTLTHLQRKFNINSKVLDLFDKNQINSIQPSNFLRQQLEEAAELPLWTEKARSELIILPVLMEMRRINKKFFTIYSGSVLNVDKEKGLTGECDFLLTKDTGSFPINHPIITIAEAKKQDMEAGINQCAAQLYGAFIFNEQSGTPVDKIYGCATTGDDWKFMCLENNVIFVDKMIYYKSDMEKILGVFQVIIDYYKTILN